MKFYLLFLLASVLLIGCKSNQPMPNTPGDALKQYVAASQKGDIETMRHLLSKGSLELIEKSAKAQGTTTDEILRKESSVKIQNAPEVKNEKIEGDTATVEIKNETNGAFDMKMPFVREDGAWKIARDKYIEELMKKATEDINKKLVESSVSNSNSAVNNQGK
jgi:hypothetical protein